MRYYDLPQGTPIRQVIDGWMKGNKPYDRSYPIWYSAAELWSHREYTWTRGKSRRTSQEWDELARSLVEHGWNPNDPLVLYIGKDGSSKVGEGNHRLAIARKLGIEVPVRFLPVEHHVSKEKVPSGYRMLSDETGRAYVESHDEPKQKVSQPAKPTSEKTRRRVSRLAGILGADPGPSRSAEHEATVDEIMDLLGEPRRNPPTVSSTLPQTVRLYHGTTAHRAEQIRSHGFDVNADRSHDPGDFGWGTYFTTNLSRAKSYGRSIVQVDIDTSRFAYIRNPYFLDRFTDVLPETDEEKLFHRIAFSKGTMLTVKGTDRIAVSKSIARKFIDAGYNGIISGPDMFGHYEVVIFVNWPIKPSENPNVSAIISRALDEYGEGYLSGECFAWALALHNAIFKNGVIVLSVNEPILKHSDQVIGHAAVLADGEYWDGGGKTDLKTILKFADLNPAQYDPECRDAIVSHHAKLAGVTPYEWVSTGMYKKVKLISYTSEDEFFNRVNGTGGLLAGRASELIELLKDASKPIDNPVKPTVSAVIIRKGDRVLLLKRSPVVNHPGKWNLPMGHIEPGETPKQAAVRETREESSLRVSELRHIKNVLHGRTVVAYFEAQSFTGRPRIDFESSDIRWVPMSKLREYNCLPGLKKVLASRRTNPVVTKSDLLDALDHMSDVAERKLRIDEFDVSEVRSIPVDELWYYDDIDSWSEWDQGELSSMSPEERRDELVKFRGVDFANRAERWIKYGTVPPIVIVESQSGIGIGDGRGRTSVAIGMGWQSIPAVIVKELGTKMNPTITPKKKVLAAENPVMGVIEELQAKIDRELRLHGLSDKALKLIGKQEKYKASKAVGFDEVPGTSYVECSHCGKRFDYRSRKAINTHAVKKHGISPQASRNYLEELNQVLAKENPTMTSKEQDALYALLGHVISLKLTPSSLKTPQAKRVLATYFEELGYRRDRYGNLLHPTKKDERIHFSKVRIQWQFKSYGTWRNHKTASPVDAATALIIEAAKLKGDQRLVDLWTKKKAAKKQAKATAAKRRVKKAQKESASILAFKQMAYEEPRVMALAGYGVKLLDHDVFKALEQKRDALIEKYESVVEAGNIPSDSSFASADRPPVLPLFYEPISYTWTETVDGYEYTVHVKYAAKNVAIITIGSAGPLGMTVNPRTHRIEQAMFDAKGDAQISGQVAFNGETFLASLFMITSESKQKGAGTRIMSIWCRMMAGYGIEAFRGEAVGAEGVAFIKALQAKGKLEVLSVKGSNVLVRCMAPILGGEQDWRPSEMVPEDYYANPTGKSGEPRHTYTIKKLSKASEAFLTGAKRRHVPATYILVRDDGNVIGYISRIMSGGWGGPANWQLAVGSKTRSGFTSLAKLRSKLADGKLDYFISVAYEGKPPMDWMPSTIDEMKRKAEAKDNPAKGSNVLVRCMAPILGGEQDWRPSEMVPEDYYASNPTGKAHEFFIESIECHKDGKTAHVISGKGTRYFVFASTDPIRSWSRAERIDKRGQGHPLRVDTYLFKWLVSFVIASRCPKAEAKGNPVYVEQSENKHSNPTSKMVTHAPGTILALKVERCPIYATSERHAKGKRSTKRVRVSQVLDDGRMIVKDMKAKTMYGGVRVPTTYSLSLQSDGGHLFGEKSRYEVYDVSVTKSNPVHVEQPEEEGQYLIPAARIKNLEKRIATFERKSKKLKAKDPIHFEILGEERLPVFDEMGEPTGRFKLFKRIQLHGTAPTVAGYTFIARVQHTPAGNIIDRAPDTESVKLPKSLWQAEATCEHCKLERRRNETFVLRNDKTGKLIRVGRSCLADFLRSGDPAAALALWSLIDAVKKLASEADEDDGFGSGAYVLDLEDYLSRVVRVIDETGWVSSKQAYETGGSSTASLAEWSTFPPSPRSTPSERATWQAYQPTEQSTKVARKAIEWAKKVKATNDYMQNIQVLANLSYVPPKSVALAASIIATYRRDVEKRLEAKREKKRAEGKVNEWFGEPGKQYIRKLTLIRIIDIDSMYGVTHLHIFEDEDGRSVKWFASNRPLDPRFESLGDALAAGKDSWPVAPGETFWYKFTIKKHDTWDNKKTGIMEKSTLITRATPFKDKPPVKWVDDATGEVFKSKKAMMAAQAKSNPAKSAVDMAIDAFVETLPPGQWVHIRIDQKHGEPPKVVKVENLRDMKAVMAVKRRGGIAVHRSKWFAKDNPSPTLKGALALDEYQKAYDVKGQLVQPGDYVSIKVYPKGTRRGWVELSDRQGVVVPGGYVRGLRVDCDGTKYPLPGPKGTRKLKTPKGNPSGKSVIRDERGRVLYEVPGGIEQYVDAKPNPSAMVEMSDQAKATFKQAMRNAEAGKKLTKDERITVVAEAVARFVRNNKYAEQPSFSKLASRSPIRLKSFMDTARRYTSDIEKALNNSVRLKYVAGYYVPSGAGRFGRLGGGKQARYEDPCLKITR